MSAPYADKALAVRLERAESLGVLEYTETQMRVDAPAGAAWLEVGEGYALYNGPTSPVGRAIGIGMAEEVRSDQVDAVEEFYREHGGTSKVTVCPHSHPSLIELLNARQYSVAMFLNVLYRRIGPGDEFNADSTATVHQTAASDETAWMDVVSKGFLEGREDTGDPYAIPRPMFHAENNRLFIARVNGHDAGGAAMSVREGVTYFFSTSVLPEYRKKGVQSKMLAVRLQAALDAGCDLAAVNTVPGSGSQRNMERFGFRLAYSKLVMARRVAA